MSNTKIEKEKQRAKAIASDFINMLDTLDDDGKSECLTEIARLLKRDYDALLDVNIESEVAEWADQFDIYTASATMLFKWKTNYE